MFPDKRAKIIHENGLDLPCLMTAVKQFKINVDRDYNTVFNVESNC